MREGEISSLALGRRAGLFCCLGMALVTEEEWDSRDTYDPRPQAQPLVLSIPSSDFSEKKEGRLIPPQVSSKQVLTGLPVVV